MSFIKKYIAFSYGNWISALISFITVPIVSYLVIPEEFGRAAMFTLAVNFVMSFCMLGTEQSFIRLFYEKEEGEERANLLFSCIIVPGIIIITVSLVSLYFWRDISYILFEKEVFGAYLCLILALFFSMFHKYTMVVIRMKQRGKLYSNLTIVYTFINTVTIILYSYFVEKTFLAILIGATLAWTISSIIAFIVEYKFWFSIKKYYKNDIINILKYGLPFVPTFIIGWFLEGVNKLSLKAYCDFNDLGIFETAMKVIGTMAIIQTGFNIYWAAASIEHYQKDPTDTQFFAQFFKYMCPLLFLAVGGLILFKDVIISLFDISYQETVYLIPFLVFMPLMYTLSEITFIGINFKKKTYWHIIIVSMVVLINLGINMILLPYLGVIAVAVSTAIAYTAFFIIRTIISQRLYFVKYSFRKFIIGSILLLGMAVCNTFYAVSYLYNILFIIGLLLLFMSEIRYCIFYIEVLLKRK